MPKKKKTKLVILPWCWYCEREFEDEKVLMQHQKAKHYKCRHCPRKLNTAGGLAVHIQQVHKLDPEKIDNALPGRDGGEVEIFGMEGVPKSDIDAWRRKKEQEAGLAAGSTSQPPQKRPKLDKKVIPESELASQLAQHKALMSGSDTNRPIMGMSGPTANGAPTVYGAPQTYAVPPPGPGGAPPPGAPPSGMPPFPGAPPPMGQLPPGMPMPPFPPFPPGMARPPFPLGPNGVPIPPPPGMGMPPFGPGIGGPPPAAALLPPPGAQFLSGGGSTPGSLPNAIPPPSGTPVPPAPGLGPGSLPVTPGPGPAPSSEAMETDEKKVQAKLGDVQQAQTNPPLKEGIEMVWSDPDYLPAERRSQDPQYAFVDRKLPIVEDDDAPGSAAAVPAGTEPRGTKRARAEDFLDS